jgi:hypothetical protein
MTSLIVVLLVGAVAMARLWMLRGSPRAILTFAVPAALLPLATAIAVGALQYRSAMERIGETGSGGLATVIGFSLDWTRALLAGCVMTFSILAIAVIQARRQHAVTAGERQPRLATSLSMFAVIAAVPVVLFAAERAVLGLLARLVPIAGLTTTDLGLSSYAALPTQEWMRLLERNLMTAVYGGLTLAIVFGLWTLATMVRPKLAALAVPLRVAAAIVVTAMGASLWYAVHMQSLTRRLATLAE